LFRALQERPEALNARQVLSGVFLKRF